MKRNLENAKGAIKDPQQARIDYAAVAATWVF
jgi:hypothetical protein